MTRWTLLARPIIATSLVVGFVSACGGGATSRHFADPKTHLTYAIPQGWFGPQTKDILPPFASVVASENVSSDTPSSTSFGAGSEKPSALAGVAAFAHPVNPGVDGLHQATDVVAAQSAEFFISYAGQRKAVIDQQTQVSGHSAWHVRYHITPDDPTADKPATVDMVGVDLPTPVYLLAIVSPDDAHLQAAVDLVIRSLTVG